MSHRISSQNTSVLPRQSVLICGKDVGKILFHIQSVCHSCGGKRIDDRARLRTLDRFCKQPVLPSYYKWSDCILCSVVIYGDASVFKTAVKISPFIQAILHCSRKLGVNNAPSPPSPLHHLKHILQLILLLAVCAVVDLIGYTLIFF